MDLTEARKRIIVAVDVPDLDKAWEITDKLDSTGVLFKIGLELIVPFGIGEILNRLTTDQIENDRFFIDAKLCDIPNTVGAAARQIAMCDVGMFNVHASAGADAMAVAVQNRGVSKVLAVTILTSLSNEQCKEIYGNEPNDAVLLLALLAHTAGVQGLICSPKELTMLHEHRVAEDMLKITPGVRPTWAAANDQKRVMTPAEAIRAGATHLVIGRPITKPPESLGGELYERMEKAVDLIAAEIAGAPAEVVA
ncbi:MAG TPA: orotidine-5'-phosphate decarboxylase [Candidatus Vogelbacteria bacterium]|uniref:Orotidine 5'-phosphate decarboxylase n=1 Tax=Candidatus Vogelbacteria bacterium RIFOXYD1_FULL_51_18 TaxID=1802440 RepID=A0A1G2QJG9_9BACT|nr:MAG: Orotidine 5'-phosphate decarboxylase [Parcubacteria group bacterium GW2011_GWC1_51_35]KKW25992.1 MAG: Orotidine 5'-phosphate decarboxylase [Parcubacteria group bacterium GW2011_GWF2_52_12]KKW27710.1 MAG: Orotidine 5'-phosphate decarboxylase [Parcubacteria group bacterium GW2011_GWF1_52_5]KKW34448.1 MAG: Orotidine 5'-phosphate decarboxylase [Parcubacteria group bacterium GW2011_GWB1_53_43]OHA60598.1 MAG: orotidine 5'-phosphate decarboxylase [Candidatus Vogelbacteria bacterium RIFOXYD1_FU